VIRGHNEYVLGGELAGLVEWLEVTGPPGVRDHLATQSQSSMVVADQTGGEVRVGP
jgi:hypothetical protein